MLFYTTILNRVFYLFWIYTCVLLIDVFNGCSLVQLNRLLKEINRLLSKEMSNIYLKVTIEKKWRTQNFDFISSKSSSPGQFLGSSNSSRYYWTFKQNCVWFLYYSYFERNFYILKSESLCSLLNKNMNFNKNETESKLENPTHRSREINLVLQLVLKLQIKSTAMMSWSSQKKRVHFLQHLFCLKEIFLTFMLYLNV